MKTLIQLQSECISRMLEPRTSENRAVKNRYAAIRALRKQLAKRGHTDHGINLLVKDTVDMYLLEAKEEEV